MPICSIVPPVTSVVTEVYTYYLLFAKGSPSCSTLVSVKIVAYLDKKGVTHFQPNPKCRNAYEFSNVLAKFSGSLDLNLKTNKM